MSNVAAPVSMASNSPLEVLNNAAKGPSAEDLASNYKNDFTYTLIKFVILTIVFILVLIYVFLGGGVSEIAQNWPKYRCNPMVMPFASLFGYDASENFNFCMKNIFQLNAGAVLGPLYGVMANFTDVVGVISNVANSFRYLIANLLHGMEKLMGSFRDRFQAILFSVRMSFLKILGLMGRLYATFYAVVFMGLSALRAAQNVADNDLVKFLLEFCFDPETPITLADGATVPLHAVKIGDRLALVKGHTPVVTSVFKFDGYGTPMVRIGETVVSAKHFMYYAPLASWIEAGDHPDAVVTMSLPTLVCLNTSSHVLSVGGEIFSDYDESSNADVIKQTQILAEKTLNGGRYDMPIKATESYTLGVSGSALVHLQGGRVVPLDSVAVGNILAGGGKVLGIVKEEVTSVVRCGTTLVSASQIVWHNETKSWRRAGQIWKSYTVEPTIMYQLIVDTNMFRCGDYVYRDYREVSLPEMESSYSDYLKGAVMA